MRVWSELRSPHHDSIGMISRSHLFGPLPSFTSLISPLSPDTARDGDLCVVGQVTTIFGGVDLPTALNACFHLVSLHLSDSDSAVSISTSAMYSGSQSYVRCENGQTRLASDNPEALP